MNQYFQLARYYCFRLSRKPSIGNRATTDENKKLKFLETTPIYGLVELNTPIEQDLTPEEIAVYKALRTYGPTTVITNDAGAEMEATLCGRYQGVHRQEIYGI